MGQYDGHGWIKVARHEYDPTKSWEENYRDLERHHIAETSFPIEELRKLAEGRAESTPTLEAAEGSSGG